MHRKAPQYDFFTPRQTLVWAALTEDVRKSHLKELNALQSWMSRCPSAAEKSVDALISVYLGHVQRERKVCWATVERIATTIVGAISL